MLGLDRADHLVDYRFGQAHCREWLADLSLRDRERRSDGRDRRDRADHGALPTTGGAPPCRQRRGDQRWSRTERWRRTTWVCLTRATSRPPPSMTSVSTTITVGQRRYHPVQPVVVDQSTDRLQISLLRHYTWRRMVCAASTPASPGSGYAGPHLPGWWPTDGVTRLSTR